MPTAEESRSVSASPRFEPRTGTSSDRFARATGRPYVPRLLVVDGHRTIVVRTAEIELLTAAANYVELCLPGRVHLLRASLASLEQMLDPAQFMRVHRQAIVNVAAVREIDRDVGSWEVVLENGRRQTVARSRQEMLLAWLAGEPAAQTPSTRARSTSGRESNRYDSWPGSSSGAPTGRATRRLAPARPARWRWSSSRVARSCTAKGVALSRFYLAQVNPLPHIVAQP